MVTDVKENLIPASILNETLVNNLAKQHMSGWFCFIQTSDGKVVAVAHPQNEEVQVVNFKKGIAAAFQANFRGTAEEIETDPQSMHHTHYTYSSMHGEVRKMHRSIRSYDVLEYSSNIGAQDVHFYEEDDIEYRDGTLIKSNGTLFFSTDKTNDGSFKTHETDPLSSVTTAQGSFSMQLKACKFVSSDDRRRKRAVQQQDLDRSFAKEENLMAKFDQEKIEIERLQQLRQNLSTPGQVVAALHDTSSCMSYIKCINFCYVGLGPESAYKSEKFVTKKCARKNAMHFWPVNAHTWYT
jgi:hypothetical protein